VPTLILLFALLIPLNFANAQSTQKVQAQPKKPTPQLERISTTKYIMGGLVGTTLGFGVGHAIQGSGRYKKRGKIFTIAQGASAAAIIMGYSLCDEDNTIEDCISGLLLVGAGSGAFISFKVWEIFEIWIGGASHNRKVQRFEDQQKQNLSFYILPKSRKKPASFNLTYNF